MKGNILEFDNNIIIIDEISSMSWDRKYSSSFNPNPHPMVIAVEFIFKNGKIKKFHFTEKCFTTFYSLLKLKLKGGDNEK